MSPELINSRNGAKGYDGQSVDVWASGVLLIVMLLGTFPFDHIEHPDPNTSEAHLEVWCATPLQTRGATLYLALLVAWPHKPDSNEDMTGVSSLCWDGRHVGCPVLMTAAFAGCSR